MQSETYKNYIESIELNLTAFTTDLISDWEYFREPKHLSGETEEEVRLWMKSFSQSVSPRSSSEISWHSSWRCRSEVVWPPSPLCCPWWRGSGRGRRSPPPLLLKSPSWCRHWRKWPDDHQETSPAIKRKKYCWPEPLSFSLHINPSMKFLLIYH